MDGAGSSSDLELPPPLPSPRRRRSLRMVRGLLRLGAVLSVLVLLLALGILVVLRTGPGQAFALNRAIAFLEGRIDGELRVGGIRSASLLGGFVLHEVALVGPGGRPFLEVDSLAVAYSPAPLLAGEVLLDRVRLWRPRVTLEPSAADPERLNVLEIFRVDPGGEAEPGRPPRIRLRDVGLQDGTVIVRIPAGEGGEALPREHLPGVGEVNRIAVRGLEALLPQVSVSDPSGPPGQRITIQRLGAEVQLFETPFQVEEIRGVLSLTPDSLRLEADRLWLTGTELAGSFVMALGTRQPALEADLEASVLRLSDFRWLLPELPDGTGGGRVRVRMEAGALDIAVRGFDLQSGRSRVRGGGEVILPADGAPLRLAGVDVEVLPLALESVNPWLLEPLPLAGVVRGRIRADGPLEALRIAGQATLEEPGRSPSTAVVTGTLHLGANPGGTGLVVTVDPLDYALVGDLVPAFRLRGGGRVEASTDGRWGERMNVSATVVHAHPGGQSSEVEIRGSIVGRDASMAVDLEGDLRPLVTGSVARDWGGVPDAGTVSGSIAARGPLRDLTVTVSLDTRGGALVGEARLDALDPSRGYQLQAEVESFDVAALLPQVPDSTTISGRVEAEGRGFDPATLEASARVTIGPSMVAGLPLEGASLSARLGDGHLTVAALDLRSPALRLSGAGGLALEPLDGPLLLPGESASDPRWIRDGPGGLPAVPPPPLPGAADDLPLLRLEVQGTDLEVLRPFLMPGRTMTRDGLTPLDMELLRLEGIDPDTLPTADQVALGGDIQGEIILRGAVTDFRADGDLRLEGFRWGRTRLSGGRLVFSLPDPLHAPARGAARLDASEVQGLGRTFDAVTAFLGVVNGEGEGAVRLARESEREEILARSTFSLRGQGGVEATLTHLSLSGDDGAWVLRNPARIDVDSTAVRVADFRLWRPEPGGVRIEADGVLPRQGDADFTLTVEDLDLARMEALLQTELGLAGVLGMEARVTGTASDPRIRAVLSGTDLRWQTLPLARVDAELEYDDQRLEVVMESREGGRRILAARLGIPADLAFREVPARFPDRPLDGEIRLEAFPAAVAFALLDVLEDVQGSLSGEVQLRGTLRDLSPTGRVVLSGGAATLDELGVRYTGVELEALLESGGLIRVDGTVRARGAARVAGSVNVSNLADPSFDLAIAMAGFQLADRRDIQARAGGNVTLTGSFRQPLVGGTVRVEQANLFLDEFVRAATVVDLTDPAFFNVVDVTAGGSLRPILEASQNPFIQSLRMGVELSMDRDVWLRSSQLNVEISGDLFTVFDRQLKEIILVGQLEAVRGSYNGFGRRFEVQEGIVEFAGTPGIDPRLDIRATTRLRTQDELLNIVANLEGTLLEPRVSLTSDSEPPLAESELASYLIFGRPSPFLTAGELSIVRSATGAVQSLGLGVVANQLGATVAQQVGLDYFAITTASEADFLGSSAGFRGSVAATQFELGQYLADDVFVALMLRPLSGFGDAGQSQFSGARVEWRFARSWTVEAFVEDRFSREGLSGFRELGFSTAKAMGLLVYREWGY